MIKKDIFILVGASLLSVGIRVPANAGQRVFYEHPEFIVYADSVEREGSRATVHPDTGRIESSASFDWKSYGRPPFKPMERIATWDPGRIPETLPRFQSGFPIVDAVYRMALETVQNMVDMPPEGVLNASAGRPPWVRDTAYVVLDGMAHLFPSACRKSLEHTADKNGTVKPEQMYAIHEPSLKNPGTPVLQPCYAMSDFVIWLPAAMEYTLAAGDREFLDTYYDCMVRTLRLVREEKFDPYDGLYDGGETIGDGSSAYPEDMTGLAQMKGSSVNLIHYQALRTVVRAGEMLGKPPETLENYLRQASRLRDAIDRELWIPHLGFHSLFKIDRNPMVVERASAMACAFGVLFNALEPERQAQMLDAFPDQKWGAPVLWPPWMNRSAYHDQNMWPNVDANWAVAAAKAGNPGRLTKGMALLVQNAAFELGFNEMIGLFHGDHRGLKPQLWAATGFLRMVSEGVLGLEVHPQGLIVQPNVPEVFEKGFSVENLHWRDAVLDIRVTGYGTHIERFAVNGTNQINLLSSDLSGKQNIEIVMTDESPVGPDVPFKTPIFEPVTVKADTALLHVLFGETGTIQTLTPFVPGTFVIPWPDQTVADRILVLPADEDFSRRGRWQNINVCPAAEAGFSPGILEFAQPLSAEHQADVKLTIQNNRLEPETLNVQITSSLPDILILPHPEQVQVPAKGEIQMDLTILLPTGLSYGEFPITAVISDSSGKHAEASLPVKVFHEIDLRGIWMMKGTEQENAADPGLYDVTDGWEFVRVPRRWELTERYHEYGGVMWYRKTVLVPSAWNGHDLEFYLRTLSGEGTVFFNGVEIGTSSRQRDGRYRIPADIVKPAENNLIAIRVFNKSSWPKSGMTDWPVQLKVLP